MLKRSGPPKRKTPLKRDGAGARKFADQRSKIAPRSAKRIADDPERAKVRAEVIRRAGGECQYAAIIPETRCGYYPPDRRGLECDELRGGSWRSIEYKDADQCRAACPVHHDWKTAHKSEVLRRLAEYESKQQPNDREV